MRYTAGDHSRNCPLIVLVVGFALFFWVRSGLTAETGESPPAAAAETAPLLPEEPAPYYQTVGDYFFGYRWVSNQDSLKAAEYIYPHSSLTFGFDVLSCPLPWRYHVNSEFLSDNDFYTDAGFAYKDLILYRDLLLGTHHNLNHYSYQFPGETGLTNSDRNPGDLYDTDYVSNLASLRLKAPDFPMHAFLNQRHIERDGLVQQRFLLGYFGSLNKVSESREIDWKSDAVKLGANSHLGPIEIEYAYDQADFSPEGDTALYDTYPDLAARPGDTYPHHVIADTESSENSVKLHSSYTGSVVTAATLSNLYQKNNYSETESSTAKGFFDFSWIPDPVVGLFFKYRHRNEEIDTPDMVTLNGISRTLNYSVREGVSYDKDKLSLSARYRPLKILALFTGYEFSLLDRNDVSEWAVLPEETKIHTLTFTAQANPADTLKAKANYEYKNYDQPAYNDIPDNAHKLRLTTTYMPTLWLNLDLEYILTISDREGLRYLNPTPAVLLEIGDRNSKSDQLLTSLTTALSANASLTASWFYQRWDVEQDLTYGKRSLANLGDLPYIDTGVPYVDESNSFSLSVAYTPRPDISLITGLTYTITEGETGYEDVVGGADFSLSSFSAVKASETILSLEVTKKLSKEWEVGVRSYLGLYDDRAYGLLDGNIFTTSCTFKRYL